MSPIKFVLIAAILCVSCSSDKEMPVTVKVEPYGIVVTNTGTNNYDNVRLKLNEEFKVENLTLSALEEKTIIFSQFTNSDYERFSAAKDAPTTIYIAGECNGDRYWGYFKVR